jgi:amino acid adenylation domain-containing protein
MSQMTAQSLPAAFSWRAAANPSSLAVECDGQRLTYSELERRSNQAARLLHSQGVERGVLVGVQAERSLDTVVSLLAILKAGGAYVPLDPRQGEARLASILEEAQPRLILGDPAFFGPLTKTPCLRLLQAALHGIDDTALDIEVDASDLAYVIFTSGSTGRPKGVEIEHRSLLNFLDSMLREPGFTPADSLLAVTTLAFDIAGLEMYLPLVAGGRIVMAGTETVSDGRRLASLLAESRISVMQATPATWRLLFASGWQGDRKLKVLVGGEALSPELANQLTRACKEVWNMYGPTETTIWSSLYRVTGQEQGLVPIGRPIQDTTLHILDDHLHPVPLGEPGELYIGGAGLARGYLRRPDLTAGRFIQQKHARLYRTGDVARLRADAHLEFLGRTDHQVKIRGYRIELGEIESVLERCSGVRHAVVTAREDASGEKYIVAYATLDRARPATRKQLRGCASASLPSYMVPAAYVEVPEFPLTANGKVDRNALPAPTAEDFSAGHQHVAPRNRVERKLSELWEEVLQVRPVGVTVSFFDLGGQSIQAAQLFTKMRRVFGADLPVSTLFLAPTVAKLAGVLESGGSPAAYRTLVPIQPLGSRRPVFVVHGGLGSTLFLHNLANKLGLDQPFYGLEPEGLDGKAFRRRTVEQMAEHYVQAIRTTQPEGPYQLGGYCFGGLVAVEMAQILRRMGQEVSIVALFSAPLRFHRLKAIHVALSRSAGARWKRLVSSPRAMLQRRVTAAGTAVKMSLCRAYLALGGRVPLVLRTTFVDQMLRQAEWQYRPRFYPGSLRLFRGRGLYDKDPSMGWDGLAGHVHHIVIGDSETRLRRDIMDEPLVDLLANEFRAAMAEERGEKRN